MSDFWKVITLIFMLVGLFLLLFYYTGAKEVLGAGFNGLTNTIRALQGQTPVGMSLPSGYPK
jgi:hypothetical protein